METYIMMGIGIGCLGVFISLFKFVLMPDSEQSFVIGALVGLIMAAAGIGVYFHHLASPTIG